jgi:hypothetical protein
MCIYKHASHYTFLIPHLKQNMTRAYLVTVALFALAFSFSYADDPSPLQDICVELNNSSDSVGTHFSFYYFCHVKNLH